MDTVWSPSGPQRSREAPLPVVWADVGAAAGDGEDQALIAEDLDRPHYGVAANVVLLLELLDRRQRTVAPLALGDLCPDGPRPVRAGSGLSPQRDARRRERPWR